MLGQKLQTPAEKLFGRLPDATDTEYSRRLQDRLDNAHCFGADSRQKRHYDTRVRGRHFFLAGELVWVYSP